MVNATHKLPPDLLRRAVEVKLIGSGGTGSVFAGWLAYLHKTLLALGHPAGLAVSVIDGDVVSETNCVRQLFGVGDVGRNKAEVIVERTNIGFGLGWRARPRHLRDGESLKADIVIGCVDTRAARRLIADACSRGSVQYWLDCGNNDYDGQWVLGQPAYTRPHPFVGGFQVATVPEDRRLHTVAELYPGTVDPTIPDDAPACSTVEALTRQGAFVNQVVASHAAAALARLFRFGEVSHQGEIINLASGRSFPIPVAYRAPAPAVAKPRRAGRKAVSA